MECGGLKRIHGKAGRNESRRNYKPGVREDIWPLASRGGNATIRDLSREQGSPEIGTGTRLTASLLGRGRMQKTGEAGETNMRWLYLIRLRKVI